jgi:Cu+-exporting ATPase
MTVVHRRGDDDALLLAGALEAGSSHPVAAAVAAYAARLGQLPTLGRHDAVRGSGAVGQVEGHDVRVGRPGWIVLDPSWRSDAEAGARRRSPSCRRGRRHRAQPARHRRRGPGPPRAAVDELRRLGLEPVMVTGDNGPSPRVAAAVGITDVFADARPEDKVAIVARLQSQGRVVAVIGDGINDAAALAAADLGIAMGSGTDVAIEAADITLLRDDLAAAADAVRLSRATLRTIKQNLAWAFGYNIAAIPLAAAGLLTPIVAGLAMAFSSVSVVANSLRLRRFR